MLTKDVYRNDVSMYPSLNVINMIKKILSTYFPELYFSEEVFKRIRDVI